MRKAIFFVACIVPFFSLHSLLAEPLRPNIVVILSDDQRFDTVGPDSTDTYMPATQREVFDKGIAFQRAYVTTPKCCPSRSSILTGKYASHHLVTENSTPLPLEEKLVARYLREAGYKTGIVGKFLNSSNGFPRYDDFDYWVSYAGGASRYRSISLNVNGQWTKDDRYTTRAFTEYAKQFIRDSAEQPFFLYYSAIAPHRPAIPEPKYRDFYKKIERHRPSSFNSRRSRLSKPRWIRTRKPINAKRARTMENYRRRQLATLRSLDDGVREIVQTLAAEGVLENTLIVYLSDNGIHWGEHGLFGKDSVYEESIRVPMGIRYDRLIAQPGKVRKELVANIDLAPTFLELAGVEIPQNMDGLSLTKILQSESDVVEDWRTHLFIEVWRNGGLRRRSHFGVHTGSKLYALHVGGEEELYDIDSDPLQIRNLLYRSARVVSSEVEEYRSLLEAHMQTFLSYEQLQSYSRR